jgi:dTDP-glucose 4,6-dehydratase/UDP-glucuronate decarboxylase
MNNAQLDLIRQDVAQIAANVGDAFQQLSGTRLLLTGASSYVTAYMADTVLWLNEHVLDRPCHLLALVRSPITYESRLAHLLGRDDVTFIQQDVAAPLTLDGPVEYIVHAASNASPRKYLAHPLDTMDANVIGTRQLLEIARTQGTRSVLFFSSSEVYGAVPDEHYPTPETYPGSVDPTHPRAIYAEAKRYGETLCLTYHRQYALPVKIVRVFYVYGPGIRLDDGRVMADFLNNRLHHQPIHLLSDGRALRAFSHSIDSITGFWLALLSQHNGEVFNIGGDQTVSMRELAEVFASVEDPHLPVTVTESDLEPHLRGAPSRVCPDISKARQMLGYAPGISLEDGIRRMVRWYRAAEGQEQPT